MAAALSAAGRYSAIWLFAALVGVVVTSDPTGFIVLGMAVFAEWALTNGPVKLLFDRRRPDNSEIVHLVPGWLRPPRSSSFPSGHSSAAAFSTVLWWAWSPPIGLLGAVVAIAMGLSRVVLRAHHKSDVVAGWAWGVVLALGTLALFGDALPG